MSYNDFNGVQIIMSLTELINKAAESIEKMPEAHSNSSSSTGAGASPIRLQEQCVLPSCNLHVGLLSMMAHGQPCWRWLAQILHLLLSWL